MGGGQVRNGGNYYIWRNLKCPVFSNSRIFKNSLKINKKFSFLKILKDILRFL